MPAPAPGLRWSFRSSLAWAAPALALMFAWLDPRVIAADTDAVARAAALVGELNLRPGICCLPRARSGELALALAKAGASVVLGLVPDRSTAERIRAQAVEQKLADHLVVEAGHADAVPLETGTCDLVVMDDLASADLTPRLAQEIARVLAPYRGRAVLRSANAGLGSAALVAWARQLSPEVEAVPGGGVWVTVRMVPLKGGDDWSHFNHGPDGNPVSNDSTIGRGPSHLLWFQGPYRGDKYGTYVAGGGRVFWARADHESAEVWDGMVARALSDGHVLWQRNIAPNFGRNASLMVVDGDTFYCEDANNALALDAETGKELRTFAVTTPEKQVRWMLLCDGVLVTLSGPKVDIDYKSGPTRTLSEIANNIGDELIGWDPKTARKLWTYRERKIDPNKLAAKGPSLFLYAARAYAASLDIHSGAVRWKTEAPIAEPSEPGMGWWNGANDMYTPIVGAVATDDTYVINWRPHLQSQAFDARSGELLWNHMRGKESADDKQTVQRMSLVSGMLPYWVVLGGTIYTHSMFVYYQQDGNGTIDIRTGKSTGPGFSFDYGGCGHFTATADGLFFGMTGEIFDNSVKKRIRPTFTKTACGVPQFVADGGIIKVPAPCPACMEWRGFMDTRPGEAVVPDPPASRLEQGDAPKPAATAADASDWPTYRGNEARSNASGATVPTAQAVLRWTYAPQGGPEHPLADVRPSPAIAVGGSAYMGTADGALVSVATADGTERWRYNTGGRIWSAPTYDAGRLYASSADGYLYCLNADRGELLWRYRVAPIDSRIMQWDRLSSRWPVIPCPLVHAGVVYAVAGTVAELDGTEMVALDAATGRLIWQQDWGTGQPDSNGQLAWGGGWVWLHGGDWGNARIDPKDGSFTQVRGSQWGNGWTPVHGQDIGYLGRGWIANGGNPYLMPGDKFEQVRGVCAFGLGIPAEHQVGCNVLLPNDYGNCAMPSWDAHGLLVGAADGKWYFDPSLLDDLGAVAAGDGAKKSAALIDYKLPEESEKRRSWLVATPNCGPDSRVYWPMLAANAVMVIGSDHPEWGHRSALEAVSRDTLRNSWWIDISKLPAEPVRNGPCIDRDGDVLIPFQDGSLVCFGAPRP